MFSKKKLNKLIVTDRYKNSDYKIQKVNGSYGIRYKSGEYVDLLSNSHRWTYGTKYTNHCFGSLSVVLRVFHFLNPIIEPINIQDIN